MSQEMMDISSGSDQPVLEPILDNPEPDIELAMVALERAVRLGLDRDQAEKLYL